MEIALCTPTKKQKSLIKKAYQISRKSTHQFKLGCVLYDKKILGFASNEGSKTHPDLGGLINKLHAEMKVIKYTNTNISNACMIVVRGTPEKPLLAKPCNLCLQRIKENGIRKVIYSTELGYEVLYL